MVNGSCFLSRMKTANTTLNACAATVAMAAPAASIFSPATSSRSPATLTRQATSTNNSGERLSPRPRKIADIRLYATIKKIPAPQIRT